jgi:hypothetical protein
MTKQQFDDWITRYGKAWSSLDPAAVMRLLDPSDLAYYESTFNEPKQNWEEVNKLWQVVPANQKDVTFWHEIMMIDGDAVLAHVKVTRTMVPSDEKQDIDAAFLFKINEKGLCTYFRQWRMLG